MCLPTRKENNLRLRGWSNCECQHTGTKEDCGFWSAPLLTHAGDEALSTAAIFQVRINKIWIYNPLP